MSVLVEQPRSHYDVVVAGSGAAGLTAALGAATAGLSVLVAEKDERLGGTSAVGGGVIWAPGNHLMADAGFTDSPADARAYLAAGSDGRMSDDEIDSYVRTAPEAVRALCGYGVRMRPLARPDYHPEWAGAARGRGLDQDPFDPRPWSGLSDLLRPPTYLPLISMSERDGLAGRAPDPGLLERRRAERVRTMGGALVGRLVVAAIERGVDLVAGSPVSELERTGDGWALTVGSTRVTAGAVTLASGGFEWSPALRQAYLPFPVTPISAPSNTGDGLHLGLAAGAAVAEMTSVWGVPVIAPPSAVYDGMPSGRMGNVEMTMPGSITVNAAGRRFVNEATNYHDLNRAFGTVDPATGRHANAPAFLVFDRTYAERYPVAGSPPDSEPWISRSADLASLARTIGVDPDGLLDTVASFNEHARDGEDPQFGRGASQQDRHLGDPAVTPNPCLAPLEVPPFYAVPVHAGVLGTAGGLATDRDGRVLDHDGVIMDGLFAAGNCAATLFKDAYPGGGATLGSAVVRAYRAGARLSLDLNPSADRPASEVAG
ncbi:FAD-dependent oxidoreductase [Prauserella alba]|uniref:3-oxosteroid 1-dehydrogenase n=1 Tax=Prauserella alba TaxID=176898 RepID=A0ABP4FQS7_9PSEU|nr:FAD-dependent oxidoreductase [Prauserella alba]MCP2183175.1 3-oxosteroid 1-dehydrogenase [Prauserella alba]